MVFVWSQLTRGDATYTLVQVSVNDVIMVFAFAPIVAFLLGVTDIVVPWGTLILSVVLFVALPLVAGIWTRRRLRSEQRIEAFRNRVKPWSVIGLIATVVILFGLQGQVILDRPLVIEAEPGCVERPIIDGGWRPGMDPSERGGSWRVMAVSTNGVLHLRGVDVVGGYRAWPNSVRRVLPAARPPPGRPPFLLRPRFGRQCRDGHLRRH